MDSEIRVVSVVEHPERAKYHELAGADTVLSPRPLRGGRLAEVVTGGVATDGSDSIEIGEDFGVAEVMVHQGTLLADKTLSETDLRERAGVNVIGAWRRGSFETPVDPGTVLQPGTILLVTGEPRRLERLQQLPMGSVRQFGDGEIIVVGRGEVGKRVTAALDQSNHSYTVVDREDGPAVDVVGEASDLDTLQAAGIDEARSAVLAIPDDTEAEFATLVMRDRNADLDIAARAEEHEAVQKLYRAGANYGLSLAQVTGRMIASAVVDGAEAITTDTQVEGMETRAPGLAGQTLGEAAVPEGTGCTVVAVKREGDIVTDLGSLFEFREEDHVVIAGTDEGTNRFAQRFG